MKKPKKIKQNTLLWEGWCIVDKENTILYSYSGKINAMALSLAMNIRITDPMETKVVKAETRIVK